jgi:dTDP-4-dehydrorhamnose reductase
MTHAPILVTGGSGQVGSAVIRQGELAGLEIVSPTSKELDFTDEASIVAVLQGQKWRGIINCAAYTEVDKAESQPDRAYQINCQAPAIIAREAARIGTPLIHVSTDYVFDGTKLSPYIECDLVNPINVYGRTKEAGEAAIRDVGGTHAIIRTAWVVSSRGANFVNTMLRLGKERSDIGVVNDQIGCPSNADDIANALLTVALNLDGRRGTWHFVNSGEANWHDLAAHIFAETRKRGLKSPNLRAITTADYPTPARRPANSRLGTTAIENDFSLKPRPWQDAVESILGELLH